MHPANAVFWARCKERYPRYFRGTRVLEFGSYNINGSIRDFFETADYTGIDWRPGPLVDLVSLAHDVCVSPADVVASASMLEHDPYWGSSLANMVRHLRPDGILIVTWGCARNAEHCLAEAPDGRFHALPAGRVLRKLEQLGLHLQEFYYERSVAEGSVFVGGRGGTGEGCLVAFKSEATQRPYEMFKGRDTLLPEDDV